MNNKNILIVDNCDTSVEALTILIEKATPYTPIINTDYNSIIQYYTPTQYEYIIIEHNCKYSDELVNFICTTNPQQKVILLSDSINCPIDCESCLSSLKFVRLLKPIDFKSVLYYLDPLNEFICPNKYRFDSIDTIEKLFDFINLEPNWFYTKKRVVNKRLMITSTHKSSVNINELERIKDNVNTKYFNLEVLEDTIVISNKQEQ